MKILKWICEYIRRDKTIIEDIKDEVRVASVEDKMRQG